MDQEGLFAMGLSAGAVALSIRHLAREGAVRHRRRIFEVLAMVIGELSRLVHVACPLGLRPASARRLPLWPGQGGSCPSLAELVKGGHRSAAGGGPQVEPRSSPRGRS